jgi:hypothetical protein
MSRIFSILFPSKAHKYTAPFFPLHIKSFTGKGPGKITILMAVSAILRAIVLVNLVQIYKFWLVLAFEDSFRIVEGEGFGLWLGLHI